MAGTNRLALARAVSTVALAVLAVACDGPEPAAPQPAAQQQQPKKPAGGFVDVAREAGITFKMEFLPGEQGEHFKVNLYDHGTGVAVADVDGDGDDDVYFVNQLGKNALFRNDGGRFTDVTAAAGLAVGDRVCVAAAFGDVDGDGDQDLYVTSTRGGNLFFRNDGAGHFTDATAEAGLTLVAHSELAAFFDYDGDGDLDLFVTNTGKWTLDRRDPSDRYFEGGALLFELAASPIERNALYRNDGTGHFTDVTAEAGVGGNGWGADMAVVDYDDDRRPDLVVTNMFGSSILFHNEGGGRFKDVTRTALGRTSFGTMGVKALDYDGDGRLDLMLADMHSDMWVPAGPVRPEIDERRKYDGIAGPSVERGLMTPDGVREFAEKLHVRPGEVVFGNTLFHNLGGGRFEEVSDKAGAETFWPWGVAAADFDMDGDVDMYLPSGMGYPWFYCRSPLLLNRGDGTFEERTREAGLDPPPGGEFLAAMVGPHLAPRSSRAAAVLDYDGDGRPDIVVVNWNDRASLLHNTYPQRHWVGLRLTGTASNRDAIGAVVAIRAAGRVQVRQVEAAGGYLAQSTKTVYFGLGDAATIEAGEIRWPSGTSQCLTDLRADEVRAVTEPAASTPPKRR